MPDALANIAHYNREPKYRARGARWGGISENLMRAHVMREKPPMPAPVEAPPTVAPIPEPPPEMIDGRFESFRVVTDYEGLCEAFSERVEDLEATRLGIDAAGRFAGGHASTLLCNPQIKGYGPTSLTKMLEATGLVIVLAIDDERFAKVKDRLIRRERPLRPAAHKPTAP